MKATLELNESVVSRDRAAPALTGPSPTGPQPTHEMVARRAYEIWQRHGCPSGTAFHDWLAAEADLRSVRRYGRRERRGTRPR